MPLPIGATSPAASLIAYVVARAAGQPWLRDPEITSKHLFTEDLWADDDRRPVPTPKGTSDA